MIDERLKHPDAYPHWTDDTLRFGDTDLLGHINTASYVTYCDTARLTLCIELGIIGENLTTAAVVARTTVNLLRELFAPGQVRIGTGILHTGTSSFTIAQGLFSQNACAAVAETVLVHFSKATRRPAPISAELAGRLQKVAIRR